MSNLIKNENILLILKHVSYILLIIIGFFITTMLIKTSFNLGSYLGTFIRGIYNLVCTY